tara:strand:- start:1103 stop:1312 length:210 start_codon:yes stop_codon:yes gene_type:complete
LFDAQDDAKAQIPIATISIAVALMHFFIIDFNGSFWIKKAKPQKKVPALGVHPVKVLAYLQSESWKYSG